MIIASKVSVLLWNVNHFDVHCNLAQNEETSQEVSATLGSRSLENSGL